MGKNEKSIQKQYELFPIGLVKEEQGHTYVNMLPQFKPALKYLDCFSHALIYYGTDHNSLDIAVSRVIRMDGKNGYFESDSGYLHDGFNIFDIKPYFPCEDRIQNTETPNYMRDWPKWRDKDLYNKADVTLLKSFEIPLNKGHLNPVGHIRKSEGEFYLQLGELNPELFHNLKGFSHIRIIWWFDKYDKKTYRKITECNPPYEKAPRTGVFATRSPVRPNPIATTTARILSIDEDRKVMKVTGLDAFDKTPIISIQPYIPARDRVEEFFVPDWLKHWPEWVDDREENLLCQDMDIPPSDIDRIKRYLTVEQVHQPVGNETIENVLSDDGNSSDIIIKGARQNNLKNLNCAIPKNKLTVITGVSGSGKSSLAFDTIYAESQRRFINSMSSGRYQSDQMEKPDFDEISGLPPAIAIEQKSVGRNPRSTVGTMTDIYDYLRLLFAKIGVRHCPKCKKAVIPLKEEVIVNILENLLPGTIFKVYPYKKVSSFEEFKIPLDKGRNTLSKCLKQALSQGNGAVIVKVNDSEEFLFHTKDMCFHCNHVFFELTTSTFSFNNPESMCPICKGMGVKLELDPNRIVSDPSASILDGASEWWGNLRKHREKPNANWMRGEILALANEMEIDLELPWKQLPENFRKQALYGSEGRKVSFTYENSNGRKGEIVRAVEGAYHSINRLFRENSGETAARIAKVFMREKICDGCHGERLSAEGRFVSIAKTRFPETVVMTIDALQNWVIDLPENLTVEDYNIAKPILKELNRRLQNLIDVGVPYLTLDRAIPTLSGGEAQRLRLASQLGSGITNILYVLDEPSTGLHAKDHKNIIKTIKQLRNAGNTVIVVEHDAKTMLEADHIIDIGPGAGIHGGDISAEGTPEEVMNNPNSETGQHLLHLFHPENGGIKNRKKVAQWITLKGARQNNLKNIDVDFPLGVLTCITGVSGSGKSSLVSKTLFPAIERHLNQSVEIPGDYDSLEGLQNIDKIISITQQAIGRTPRSNPATYTGVFDEIRKVFASTKEAKEKGYGQNTFSFNSKEGQCEVCGGEGRRCIPMYFMPDIWVECSICNGKRYKKEVLDICYKGKTIADVLDMNIEEALKLFDDHKKIKNVLKTLNDVGLGYIKLGQSALTLSGGEAQRIKLAKELSKADTGRTIYLLDEPTTGLHFSDVQKLLTILHQITEAGNTVLIIEHNMDVVNEADWIIDLGPEGGNAGGYLVAQGIPEDVAKQNSYTGIELRNSFYRT